MRALLARQIDAKARPRPSSAENRPAIDPSEPILAVSPNFDRATDRRQPNHSTPNSDPKVRHTASPKSCRMCPEREIVAFALEPRQEVLDPWPQPPAEIIGEGVVHVENHDHLWASPLPDQHCCDFGIYRISRTPVEEGRKLEERRLFAACASQKSHPPQNRLPLRPWPNPGPASTDGHLEAGEGPADIGGGRSDVLGVSLPVLGGVAPREDRCVSPGRRPPPSVRMAGGLIKAGPGGVSWKHHFSIVARRASVPSWRVPSLAPENRRDRRGALG